MVCPITQGDHNEMLRRNGAVLRPEENLLWEGFVKDVGFEPTVKERGRWMVRVVSQRSEKMW